MLKKLFKDEKGQTEVTSSILILIGVGTIIALLIVVFRDRLLAIVDNIFDGFERRVPRW